MVDLDVMQVCWLIALVMFFLKALTDCCICVSESGYHSDHMDTPPSSLSESPMFDLEDRHKDSNEDKAGPFSGG